MREPVGYTCPQIDEVIADIQQLGEDYESAYDFVEEVAAVTEGRAKELFDALDTTRVDTEELIDKMEELRSANEQLRDWGAKGWEKVEELEEEIADME